MRRDANMKYGSYETRHIEILDRLPSVVRRALAEAEYHWKAGWVLNYYLTTGSAAETVAKIRQTDLERHAGVARKEKRTVFGPRSRPIYPKKGGV